MKNKLFALVLFLVLVPLSGYCSTSDALSILQISQDIKNEYGSDYTAPFNVERVSEGVSEGTGAVEIKETDLTLPGKNGLDFKLIRRFNSQSINKSYSWDEGPKDIRQLSRWYKYTFYMLGQPNVQKYFYLPFATEEELLNSEIRDSFVASYTSCMSYERQYVNYYSDLLPTYANEQTVLVTRDKSSPPLYVTSNTYWTYDVSGKAEKAIGYNWNTICPKMDDRYIYSYSNKLSDGRVSATDRTRGIFEDEHGKIFEYLYEYYHIDNTYAAVNQPNSTEYILYIDNPNSTVTHDLGFTYRFRIEHKSGKNYYFGTTGKILAIIDKYGNHMLYTHNTTNGSYTVTDTMGRIINITNTGCTVTDGNKTYTVAYNKSVDYGDYDTYNHFITDDIYMLTVTKSKLEDGVQKQSDTTKYYMNAKEILPRDAAGTGRYLQYARAEAYNVYKIEYPSNYTVEYDYEKDSAYYFYRTRGDSLKAEIYLVTERRVYENGTLKNKTMYSHNMLGIGMPDSECNDSNFKNEHTVTYSDSDLSVKQVFNKYGQKTSETRSYSGYKYEETYGYKWQNENQAGAPLIMLKRKFYNGTTAHPLDTYYNYGDNRNLLSETEGYTNTTYTYSDAYSIPLTQTYNKDANTTVVITNTLTEDGKSIACQTITENDVLKSKTEYSYNSFGDVIEEKRYATETAYDTTTYTHTYSTAGKTFTKTTINMTETFVYDIFGNLVSYTDGNGNITTYEYDMYNRITKQTNPDGTIKLTEYNIPQNYIVATDENGNKIKYQYSPTGNLTDVYIMENGVYKLVEHSEYDGFDRQTLYRRYNSANNYTDVQNSYDFAGRLTSTSYKDNMGVVKSGVNYSYSYSTVDSYAATTVAQAMFGETTAPVVTTVYDYRQLPLSQSVTSAGETVQTSNQYDYLGNLTQNTDQLGNVTTYTYDYAGNNLTVTNAENNTASNEYDLKGRVVKTTDYRNVSRSYIYNAKDWLVMENLVVSSGTSPLKLYNYDANGNITHYYEGVQNYGATTGVFNTTQYAYDNRNRLVKTTQHTTSGTVGEPEYTQYYYDNVGNMLRMYTGLSDPLTINGLDNVTAGADTEYSINKYTYNHLNQLVSHTNPHNRTDTYAYDYFGNLITMADCNSDILHYTYNWQSLPVSIISEYDDVSVSYTYDNYGNRTSMTDTTGTTTYTYDKFLRLNTETKGNVTKTYTYDAKNQRSRFVLNIGTATPIDLSYTWNSVGLLSSLTSGTDTVDYTYDQMGNLIDEDLNDINTHRTFYPIGYIAGMNSKVNDTQYTYFQHTYYINGNRRQMNYRLSDNQLYTAQYTYDGANRLLTETTDEVVDANNAYAYDDYGNRSAITNDTTYTYDKCNKLKTEVNSNANTNYVWCVNGTLSSKTVTLPDNTVTQTHYNFDSLYRLTQVTEGTNTYTYEYDGDGHRTAKVVNGTRTEYIWDGDYIVAEITNNVITSYIRGNKLHMSKTGDTKKYYLYNGHGDVVQLLDSNYNVVTEYKYDAFGNQLTETTDTNPFRYCGEYYDAETGLIYLRNRYYDTSVGRFISEDPIKDGLNWYVYCGNNPIKYIEPTGYWATSDSKYSSTVQAMLLQLTVAWHMAPTDEQKTDISNRANEIRETVSSGFGAFLDKGKSITGAAADEFSWFLGGDVSGAERDYWLSEAQKYQSDIKIDDKTGLRSMMFIAGIISPSPDDAWRMISKKASKEMLETVGEKGAKKFIKSISKYAGAQGTNGIKKLQGSGIKGFMYEVKVKGVGGAYRLLGNKTESGEILWELFEKTH